MALCFFDCVIFFLLELSIICAEQMENGLLLLVLQYLQLLGNAAVQKFTFFCPLAI